MHGACRGGETTRQDKGKPWGHWAGGGMCGGGSTLTVVSTFISRGYSEDVAVIVVARGGYVMAE